MKTLFYKIYPFGLLLIFLNLCGCNPSAEVHPQRRRLIDAVFASGHIENLYQYTVNANIDGYLKKLLVVEGDSVKSGQLLFKLTNDVQKSEVINAVNNLKFAQTNAASGSPQIDQLKFQIRQAQQKTTVDSLNNERYARLVKTLAVSKADADNARVQYTSSKSNLDVLESNLRDLEHTLKNNVDNARIQLEIQKENDDYYTIRASDPGVVLAVNKKLGDYAKKGDAICQIGSGMAIAKLYIAEDDIHRVKIGQPVLVSLNSNKNYILKATVRKLYPSFDTNDQSFVVDARFAPNQGKMINGTQLQANIIIEEKSNALVIPSEYLVNGDYVFIKGKTDKIPVSVGIRTLDYTEIRSGLSDQDVLLLPKQMK